MDLAYFLAAQVQYEQAPKEAVLQATKKWVESIVLRYNLCPFAVAAQKKNKILFRASFLDTALPPHINIK